MGAMASGCGPTTSASVDAGVSDECIGNATRCVGQSYQVCVGDQFEVQEQCSGVCDPALGCQSCQPNAPRVCSGTNVHSCDGSGNLGPLIEECIGGGCSNGTCTSQCGADGADLIYVVDDAYRLLSFDPRKLGMGDPFTLVGTLSCPASPSWPEWGSATATPFSMSVDRNGVAWVLYSSGEIFHVDTKTAACTATSFAKGQAGFKLFGMGFVADSPGANEETLFIAGGPVDAAGAGNLGRVDPGTLAVTSIGPLASAEYSPELTGTGDAKLYGYYPGSVSTFIAELDKGTGSRGTSWNMSPLGSTVRAWAFAHWGGRFYVFVTTSDLFLGDESNVYILDPANGGMTSTALSDIPYIIVGAGVSTCAPVFVP